MPGQALAVAMGSQQAAQGRPSSPKTVYQTEGADLEFECSSKKLALSERLH